MTDLDVDRVAGFTRLELIQAVRDMHARAVAAEQRSRELVAELERSRKRSADPNPADDPNLSPWSCQPPITDHAFMRSLVRVGLAADLCIVCDRTEAAHGSRLTASEGSC